MRKLMNIPIYFLDAFDCQSQHFTIKWRGRLGQYCSGPLNNHVNWSDSQTANRQWQNIFHGHCSIYAACWFDDSAWTQYNLTMEKANHKQNIRFFFSFFCIHPQNVYCITHSLWHKGFKVSREWKEILKWSQWLLDKMHKQIQCEWQMNTFSFCVFWKIYSLLQLGDCHVSRAKQAFDISKSATQKNTTSQTKSKGSETCPNVAIKYTWKHAEKCLLENSIYLWQNDNHEWQFYFGFGNYCIYTHLVISMWLQSKQTNHTNTFEGIQSASMEIRK